MVKKIELILKEETKVKVENEQFNLGKVRKISMLSDKNYFPRHTDLFALKIRYANPEMLRKNLKELDKLTNFLEGESVIYGKLPEKINFKTNYLIALENKVEVITRNY